MLKATLQALFVTFLWSTSWVLIKIGLGNIPPITFAGLRYSLAFFILLLVYLRSPQSEELSQIGRRDWLMLAGLGILFYKLTQGAQFLALLYLPAITFSLLLNFSAVLIAMLGTALLKERLGAFQWLGIAVSLTGGLLFFYPLSVPQVQVIGFLVAILALSANSFSSILGRAINRARRLSAVTVTVVSMGIGGSLLLITGIATQGLPTLEPRDWLIILWLAAVNTAFAFTLWNQSFAHTERGAIQHHQQHAAYSDRCAGLDISWRTPHRLGGVGHGCGRHRNFDGSAAAKEKSTDGN